MLGFQRKCGTLMRLPVKQRRLKTLFAVAGAAVGARRAARELVIVRILVTLLTTVMRQGPLEIAVLVTAGTSEIGMLVSQWKLRLIVAEARNTGPGFPPPARIVATLAATAKLGFLKSAVVRVVMAVLASGEREAAELQSLRVGSPTSMALAAVHGLMQAGKRKSRLRVIKSSHRLPGILRVAFAAFGAQFSAMLIFVTRQAFATKSQQRSIDILQLHLQPCGGRYIAGIVAGLATLLLVPALQRVARLGRVIKRLALQPDQCEFLPIVFHMATRAVSLIG
jgi:hypothetical protein